MPYVEIVVGFAIAFVFFLLGRRDGRKWTDQTQGFINSKVDEARHGIDHLNQDVSRGLTNITKQVEHTHEKINSLPEAADKLNRHSDRILGQLQGVCGELNTSVEDLRAFASTISLLEKNGFEMVVSKGDPDDKKTIGKLPSKVFVLFPKRSLLERITEAVAAGSSAVIANKVANTVADLLAPANNDDLRKRLDRIESKLDKLTKFE